jgi:signal transduction histidine kinase
MDAKAIQTVAHSLQPVFAAIFLYHAYVVRRLSKVETTVPYNCIISTSLCAAAHYFFWQCYWWFDSPSAIRIVVHLVWFFGALMIYFHIGALQAYFNPCPRWITYARRTAAALTVPAGISLLTLVVFGKMFFVSPQPMSAPPLAFPAEIQERIQRAFSINAFAGVAGVGLILIEIACFTYFLKTLIQRRGDRWLIFGLTLTLLAILNDTIATLRLDSYAISFLFVAIFVEIVRLTSLLEKANRETLLKVQHSMRLVQIGEMTATVAHELVNPLAIIMGNADIGLTSDHPDPEKTRRLFEKIQSSATRMLAIVRGLRDHARQEEIVNEKIQLDQTLTDVTELMRPLHERDGIALTLEIPSRLPHVTGDIGKLRQILLNLLQNASDATEGQAERKIRLVASLIESHVQIQITDNGCGIPQENLTKIFTPFFTTKPRGKGTGIGLSFVDSQIRLMNGQIRVASEPGRTVFTLLFPAVSE